MAAAERVFVGITGASGAVYGLRAIEVLLARGFEVLATASETGAQVLRHEVGIPSLEAFASSLAGERAARLRVFAPTDFFSPVASGSNRLRAVIVAPCSTSTLAHVAYGTTRNLVHRAADVALKQGYPVALVVRESPLSLVHIRAMEAAALAGARIVPASPGFYARPKTLKDAIDFVVGKALDAMGIEHELYERWDPSGPTAP